MEGIFSILRLKIIKKMFYLSKQRWLKPPLYISKKERYVFFLCDKSVGNFNNHANKKGHDGLRTLCVGLLFSISVCKVFPTTLSLRCGYAVPTLRCFYEMPFLRVQVGGEFICQILGKKWTKTNSANGLIIHK